MEGAVDSPQIGRRLSSLSSRNNSLDVEESLHFDGFDWTRNSQSPEHSPGSKRGSQPNILSHVRSGSTGTSSFSRSLEHRRGFKKEKSLDAGDSRRNSSPRYGARARFSNGRNSGHRNLGSYG